MIGVTCMFMASKFYEVNPLLLRDCRKTLCCDRFNHEEFVAKESYIIDVLTCTIDSPTTLDFLIFYFRILKFALHEGKPTNQFSKPLVDFIVEWETLAYDMIKACLLDPAMSGHPPSIVSASFIYYALVLCQDKVKAQTKGGSFLLKEIERMMRIWQMIML